MSRAKTTHEKWSQDTHEKWSQDKILRYREIDFFWFHRTTFG